MDLWEGIELKDIPDEQKDFAELVGLDTFRKLIEMYGGSSIYICKKDAIYRQKRNLAIVSEFNGYNYLELAKKYSLTERTIRDVVANAVTDKRATTKNQVSMFDNK